MLIKQLDNLIQEALKNAKNIQKLNELEHEFLLIDNLADYMNEWLVKKFPAIPHQYLLEYMSKILQIESEEIMFLDLMAKDVQDALFLYCTTNSIFNSDIAVLYTEGWWNSSLTDSVHMSEVIELLKEQFEGIVIDPSEFKHTILVEEEGEEEEQNNKGRKK